MYICESNKVEVEGGKQLCLVTKCDSVEQYGIRYDCC